MKRLKAKWLGIPVLAFVLVFVLVACLGGGVALGTFLFQSSNQGSVQVIGSGLGLYTDAACTIALPSGSPLPSFAAINLDATNPQSGNSVVYLKNTGTTQLNPQISVAGLKTGMTLNETQAGVINGTFKSLMSGQQFVVNPNVATITLAGALDAVVTDFNPGPAIPANAPQPGYIKIDNEVISYTTTNGGFHGVVRGTLGTTAAAHNAGAVISFGNSAPILLAPNAVRTVSLYIVPDGTIKINDTSTFTVSFEAQPGS